MEGKQKHWKELAVQTRFSSYMARLVLSKYKTFGNTCIYLVRTGREDRETITANFDLLPANQAYINTYDCTWAEHFLRSNGLGEPITGRYKRDEGWNYPLYELDIDLIRAVAWRIVE